MVLCFLIGSRVTLKWYWIGVELVQLSFIGSKLIRVALCGLIGSTVTGKWHWIDTRIVEWLFIGHKII